MLIFIDTNTNLKYVMLWISYIRAKVLLITKFETYTNILTDLVVDVKTCK